jgi:arylsulfatase A-like enzyme/thioredoxin-like negative regulator of GroEL
MKTARLTTRWLCAGGVLLLVTLAGARCRGEKPVAAGDFRGAPIIVISVDTLRSDRLPAYGYHKVTTPAFDALAADGIVFERAFSNVPLTLPSHTSLLTGLLPPEHGVRNNIGYHYDVKKHPPITAALRSAGYESAGIVSSYVLRGNTGMADAFDFYDDAIANESGIAIGRLQRPGMTSLEVATSWLDRKKDGPFFLLFHIFEPHAPYEASEPFRSRFADPYDAEIAASDDVVAKLIERLKSKGLYDQAIIILLSDHGEGLGDHGEEEHGVFLYREALQVPLIVKLPASKRKGERVTTPVALTDVAPMIAALTGVPAPAGSRGVNILDGAALAPERALYAETLYPRIHLGWSELRSLIRGKDHYIEAPKPELYDLVADAAETKNILGEQRRTYAALREELSGFNKAIEGPSAVSAEEAAKLEALGYLGSVKSAEGALPDPKDRIGDFALLQQAHRLAAEGRAREAEGVLRKMLAVNPRFGDAWAKLGSVLEAMGREDDAIAAYADGIRVSPESSAEFALSIAALHLQQKRLEEARKHAALALERNPAGAHQLLARIALEGGDLALAEREAQAATSDEPSKPRAMVTLAQVRMRQGRMEEATRILESTRNEARTRQMRVEHLELTLGDIYAKTDRLPQAEQAFRAEIAAFPANLTAYANLAVVLVIQKRFDEIDPLFEAMARKNPTRRAALVAGQTYEVLGDDRTAATWRARAARL